MFRSFDSSCEAALSAKVRLIGLSSMLKENRGKKKASFLVLDEVSTIGEGRDLF